MRNYLNTLLSLLFFISSAFTSLAQSHEILPLGVAPASAGVAYQRQWFAWDNPAALVAPKSISLSAAYENRYFLPELSDAYVSIAIPTKYLNLGVAYNFFGFDRYHEMMASFTVARQFGRVAIGAEFDYFNLYLSPEVGYRHAITAQVGLQVRINENCLLGCRIFNPTFSKINYEATYRKLPVFMQIGCSYTFFNQLDLLAQFGYDLQNGFDWAVGFEYRILDALVARLGARGADYIIPSIGAGFRYENFGCDISAEADFRIGMALMSNIFYSF